MERFHQLDDMLQTTWNMLFRGATQRRNAFRTPILSSIQQDMPNARMVVLRKTNVATRQLLFYTDIRSPKVKELQANPNSCLVFWHPNKHLQVRAYGTIEIEAQNDFAKSIWDTIAPKNRKDYASLLAPSSSTDTPDNFLAPHWNVDTVTATDTTENYQNFAVLVATIERLDCLHLHSEGHQRTEFCWNGKHWDSTWLIP